MRDEYAILTGRTPVSWLGNPAQWMGSCPPMSCTPWAATSEAGNSWVLGSEHPQSCCPLHYWFFTDSEVLQGRPRSLPHHRHWSDVVIPYFIADVHKIRLQMRGICTRASPSMDLMLFPPRWRKLRVVKFMSAISLTTVALLLSSTSPITYKGGVFVLPNALGASFAGPLLLSTVQRLSKVAATYLHLVLLKRLYHDLILECIITYSHIHKFSSWLWFICQEETEGSSQLREWHADDMLNKLMRKIVLISFISVVEKVTQKLKATNYDLPFRPQEILVEGVKYTGSFHLLEKKGILKWSY